MRKFSLFSTLLLTFSTLLIICGIFIYYYLNQPKDQLSLEMVAYNGLTQEEQDLIPISPKDAVVEKITVDEIQSFIDQNYDKKEVYAVTFQNTAATSFENLTVFVSLDKKTVVGKQK